MNFLKQLFVTLLVCYILQSYLPWWSTAFGALAIGYAFDTRKGTSFFAGFFGVGLLWLFMALYIDTASASVLSEKVNRLLPINVFAFTVLVGGLTGGFSSLTGTLLKTFE